MMKDDEDDEEAGLYLSKTRGKIMTNDDEDDDGYTIPKSEVRSR